MNSVRHFLLALQFFTRIPITGRLAEWVGFSPAALRASSAHFPAVGWVLGALTAGCYALVVWRLPEQPGAPWVAAFFSTLLGVWVTGAFHEDGLADLTDGLGGSMNRERALEIMKDSRIGSFGAAALVLALMGKLAMLALLGQISPGLVCAALFAAHVSSRFAPLWLIRTMTHVGDLAGSKSKPLADAISGAALVAAGTWWLAGMALALWLYPRLPLWGGVLAGLASTWWMRRLLARRLQGFTGDGLGATQQVCELAFYLGLLLAW